MFEFNTQKAHTAYGSADVLALSCVSIRHSFTQACCPFFFAVYRVQVINIIISI